MVTEAQKQELRAAIDQVQDEAAFDKIAVLVRNVLTQQRQRGKAGFLKGSVTYLAADWDAPLADWKHLDE